VGIGNPKENTAMNTAPAANPLTRAAALPYPVSFAASVVLAALLLVLADSALTQPTEHAIAPESRIARCARLAGVAVEKLDAKGVDVQTSRSRRQRELAVQACANDFANFEWLLNGK
jgi:hypothetical protein